MAQEFDVLAEELSQMARRKGFWDQLDETLDYEQATSLVKASKIALMHSELSELLERVRAKEPEKSDKIPDFTGEEEELADLIIRALDYAGYFNLRITKAIYAKMAYNASRPHKHGKAF